MPTTEDRLVELKFALSKQNEEICQILGIALGYPYFYKDQKNFPGTTEKDGVCVGDHVAETIAMEAAKRIAKLEEEIKTLQQQNEKLQKEVAAANKGARINAEVIKIQAEKLKNKNI